MILIDAIYINNSGGKILIDYLIEQLELSELNVFYLLDKRIRGIHPDIKPTNRIYYLDGSLIQKHRFYHQHGNEFTKILCFGNFPPDIKLRPIVFTYFHQLLFILAPKELTFYTRLLVQMKTAVFRYSASNSDFWLVQSEQVREELCNKYKQIPDNRVLVLPFYPPLNNETERQRKKNKFIYVSTGYLYKNHNRLLQAFISFFDKHKTGELHLTIGDEFKELKKYIKQLQGLGYPIVNHGFVSRNALAEIYLSSEFAFYPSLAESFGLGIVEAIENGCKVIASDLPWLYAVCEPSGVFDPKSTESMFKAFEKAIFEELKPSKQLIFNQIGQIIDLLK